MRIKRRIATILTVYMVLSCTACGSDSRQDVNAGTGQQHTEIDSSILQNATSDMQEPETGEDMEDEFAASMERMENDRQAAVTAISNETVEITMTVGDTVVTAELSDSETTRAFLETLPRTLAMNRYGDREYYGRIEGITENGESIEDFENGDVTYYPAGPSFAVFFDKADTSNQSGLIRMGKITSDLSVFNELEDMVEMRIEIPDE